MSSTQELLQLARRGFQEIGYREELLINSYSFADFLSPLYPVREIPLAGFAQHPPSYKSSGFGVLIANGDSLQIENFIALGAPHVFIIKPSDGEVYRWRMNVARPEQIESINVDEFIDTIRRNGEDWGPESILRAKSLGSYNQPQQLDFFDKGLLPVLEHEVHLKLDKLFDRTLSEAINAHRKLKSTELNDNEYRGLFRLVFRLVAAKLLADRQYPGEWLDQDVVSVLNNVNDFYFKESNPEDLYLERGIQQLVWNEIRSGFHLQNLSLEALAYVYENTFVSSETRKMFDTHATPPEVAEFVVKQLPFEKISIPSERIVFEPFAGHAPFLTAALGRLRSLLPPDMSHAERHHYFVNTLYGIEFDSFAREVARYSLILADYPNPDGWQIQEANVFTSPIFDRYLKKANIVLCNPPFGQFTDNERTIYSNLRAANKAIEAILRVLEYPPQMLGFVLPRSFTDGRIYRTVRQKLAETYGNISLLALPDIAFKYSEAETVVILASDQEKNNDRHWQRIFISKNDYPDFWRTGQPTWQDEEVLTGPIDDEPNLWKHPLIKNLREHFENFKTLKDVTEIHRGIEYVDAVSNHVSNFPKSGFAKGLQKVEDGLQPYLIVSDKDKYLDLNPNAMRTKAYLHPWNLPKVIVNAARISRGPWRLVAAIDDSGLCCYQRFHGVWAKNNFCLEIIAAALNGPVANALLSAAGKSRDNLRRDLYTIPLPKLTKDDANWLIYLVQEYQKKATSQSSVNDKEAIMAQINVAVLSGYDLPSWLESELLDFIGHLEQPGMSMSLVEQIRVRHGLLVDKKFLEGLTERESNELIQINRILDASEEKYYAPIKDVLATAKASLLLEESYR
ncbi:N-6 DNA methylase [candidate division KSB1 bacterium]|nr:N-6 DNA methylase [candidate division KSB1 bacterium]